METTEFIPRNLTSENFDFRAMTARWCGEVSGWTNDIIKKFFPSYISWANFEDSQELKRFNDYAVFENGKLIAELYVSDFFGAIGLGIKVKPEEQGRGSASRLIDEFLLEAKAYVPSDRLVRIYIRPENIISQKLFSGLGFKEVEKAESKDTLSVRELVIGKYKTPTKLAYNKVMTTKKAPSDAGAIVTKAKVL